MLGLRPFGLCYGHLVYVIAKYQFGESLKGLAIENAVLFLGHLVNVMAI
jgi:hypothetical protein